MRPSRDSVLKPREHRPRHKKPQAREWRPARNFCCPIRLEPETFLSLNSIIIRKHRPGRRNCKPQKTARCVIVHLRSGSSCTRSRVCTPIIQEHRPAHENRRSKNTVQHAFFNDAVQVSRRSGRCAPIMKNVYPRQNLSFLTQQDARKQARTVPTESNRTCQGRYA